ncbi:hypothetical protein U5922_001040 (plasmid) [Aquicoccus sp. G2-2]|uniref:hypothetical protein n=1 Tax=Aquicoccus sp. G2-2 TaxID=3092120 RepID=UPI00366BAF90
MVLIVLYSGPGLAGTCIAPAHPFVPSDSRAVRDYRDIIRQDFEVYIRDIQSYFRCLEQERARAFEEAREVSEEYNRFLQLVEE